MLSIWHLLFLAAVCPLALCREVGFAEVIAPHAWERRPFDLAHWLPNMPRGHE